MCDCTCKIVLITRNGMVMYKNVSLLRLRILNLRKRYEKFLEFFAIYMCKRFGQTVIRETQDR